MDNRVRIFDTTLRDGEQSAGIAFSVADKLEIATQLERLGVNVIEAGFPCTSAGDFKAVKSISEHVRGVTICALARAVERDIDTAWEAIERAEDPRIHVFINASDLQMKNQLRKSREQVLEQTKHMVRYAARFTSNVEFSPMDATRSDPDFLVQLVDAAIASGAATINIPDSVGYAIPSEITALFARLREKVNNIHRAVLSFHGQNDLGLSTANTLAAIVGGARQIEVTINGIGERAGNTSLEEVVMALKTRESLLNFQTDIETREIYRTSKLVERLSGMPVQWNKAIVGKNAFRHGSGIHQDGILKLRETWEIMDPRSVGVPEGTQLVLGKLSGRHAFLAHLEARGFNLDAQASEAAFEAFKELADKKPSIDERDIEAILTNRYDTPTNGVWRLESLQISSGMGMTPTATVRLLSPLGETLQDASIGTGPVHAICQAINRIVGLTPSLTEFSVTSVTEGIDAQGEVSIELEGNGANFRGRSSDTDILIASAAAYLQALNRMIAKSNEAGSPLAFQSNPGHESR